MQLLNPRIAIQNTDTPYFLVTVDHEFNESERMQFTMRVDRSDLSLGELQRKAVDRSLELLNSLQRSLASNKSP